MIYTWALDCTGYFCMATFIRRGKIILFWQINSSINANNPVTIEDNLLSSELIFVKRFEPAVRYHNLGARCASLPCGRLFNATHSAHNECAEYSRISLLCLCSDVAGAALFLFTSRAKLCVRLSMKSPLMKLHWANAARRHWWRAVS